MIFSNVIGFVDHKHLNFMLVILEKPRLIFGVRYFSSLKSIIDQQVTMVHSFFINCFYYQENSFKFLSFVKNAHWFIINIVITI